MSGVSIADGVSADLPDKFLDCRNISATITLPSIPTVLVLPEIVARKNIGYDTTTGVITFYTSDVYSVYTALNVRTMATQSVYAYAEINTGSGWVPIQYSGRQIQITGNVDGQVLTISRNYFAANTQLRLYFHATGTTTVQTSNIPGTTPGTVLVPAMRLMVAV